MFVLRMALGLTVSVTMMAGAGRAAPRNDGGAKAGATNDQGETASGGKHALTSSVAKDSGPASRYSHRKKTWCDERPVQIEEEKYPDGKPKFRYEVVMNEQGEFVRHGKSETWWETGEKKLEMYYVCGVKHGVKKTWWKDGSKWSVGGFFEGKDDGTWIVWDNNGMKSKEYHIDKGVWNGPFTMWHPNGQKRLEVEFVDGLREGNMTFWDDHGNVLNTIEYLDGREQPMPGA